MDQGLDRDQGLIDLGGAAGASRRLSRWLHTKRRTRLVALIGAPSAWLLLMYIGSLIALFLNSAYRLNEDGSGIDKTLSTDNVHEILTTVVYRNVAVRTILIAVAVTVIDALLALPLAFFMAKLAKPRWRSLLVAAVLVPLWASYLVKAFSWRSLLAAPGGVLERTFGHSPGYGIGGLIIVLSYLWLPYMVVPVYAGLERLPDSLLEASGDLGARFGFTFRKVVLPIIVPSLVAGSVFTFSLTLGDYIAVSLVGGNTQMIGSIVYSNHASNLPLAAAYALVPVLVMVFYLLGIRRSGALEQL
jgi:putative spermidine/putrescine transport system permease protein